MEVNLSPDTEAKLARLAGERGRDAETLAREAIERLVDYDSWFVGEVEKGLAQIERGEVLTHEAVGARLDQYLRDKQRRF
jgi:predicted transcriptional regulator